MSPSLDARQPLVELGRKIKQGERSMEQRFRCVALLAGLSLWILIPGLAAAQQGAVEEIVVTGSYIRGTPEDSSSPVTVTTREDMNLQGNPTVLEMIRRMGPSSGIDGETNQFQSNGLEGISNVNLRGLGSGRTLVLMNGKRMMFSPYGVGETGQLFVNTNAIPAIAMERVELLKDGASATYGSDAVAGVVNFITRSNFRGLELFGNYKDIDESDGDYEAGAIVGFGTDRLDVVASFGYQFRSELQARDKDWAMEPTPATNPRGGFSGIPNPSRFLRLGAGFSPIIVTGPDGTPGVDIQNDPDCTTVGGHLNNGACNFRFTDFDNIAEEEEHYQFFLEGTYALSDLWEMHGEFLYAKDDVPEWKTSPSYPPQSLFSADRWVGGAQPHWQDFIARNPQFAPGGELEMPGGALVLGRAFGVSGPSEVGTREYDTYRVSVGLNGTFDNGVMMDAGLTYGRSEGERNTDDTAIDNLAMAYRGLGGPDCDPAAGVPGSGNAGTGDCYFYNPFTSAYTASQAFGAEGVPGPGSENSALNNPDFMQEWLTDPIGTEVTSQLTVLDLIFSGESDVMAGGGNVGWAAGVQWRREDYEVDPNEFTDLTQKPCPFGIQPGESFTMGAAVNADGLVGLPFTYECPNPGVGGYHFLAGTLPFDENQDIFALFGELAVPLTDDLNVQAAVRFEDYGGQVGSTVDPKVAARWTVTDTVTLRGSLGTSFRGPGLNQLNGRGTTLQFIVPANAFKAVDTTGNPNLAPEEAITTNLGVIWEPTPNVFATLDYWSFDFSDPIVIEPAGDIVSLAFDADATQEQRDQALAKLTFSDPDDPAAAEIQRVDVTFQNGPDVETSGFDFSLNWDLPTDNGLFTVGFEGTYILDYEVDSWIWADSFDAVGKLNRFTYVRPLPELKNTTFVNWSMGGHNLRAEWFYVDSYDDADAPPGANWGIDSHNTFDLHYNYNFNNENTRVFASVYNVTDEDPPFARLDLSYDPYTHNPFGRMIKVGVQHRFGGFN